MKLALIVEYDGTMYHGFQVQNGLPTIQGEIEEALRQVTGERIRATYAGRTDQGAHARGQVVAFSTDSTLPPRTIARALNHYLPDDIVVRESFRVADGFDPRRDALSREYRYCIWNSKAPAPLLRNSAYFVPRPLDVDAMNRACRYLVGQHDFIAFASSLDGRENTVRTVFSAAVGREGEMVNCDMVANAFLPHQVRHTVGALVKVGLGKSRPASFGELLEAKRTAAAGPAAPPHGVCLMKVNYPGDIA